MKLVYVASPYTILPEDQSSSSLQDRFEEVCDEVVSYLQSYKGMAFYSPIMHWHYASLKNNLPTDWGFWWPQNKKFLELADELWVLSYMRGCEKSKGVAKEIEYFNRLNKPILYLE